MHTRRAAYQTQGRSTAHRSAFATATLEEIDRDHNGFIDYEEGYQYLDHLRVLMTK